MALMRLLAALLLLGTSCTTIPVANRCTYDKTAMLALSEDAFDQDLSNGGGGWRKIGNTPGCELAAAGLLAAYRETHPGSDSILAWHEGQMRASAGQSSRAIPLLRAARKDPAKDPAGWNAYVDATVAFLQRDKAALADARQRLAAVPYPADSGMPPLVNGTVEFPAEAGRPAMKMRWPPNIDVVDGLVACFDKPYTAAYESSCRPAAP
jgi:hypothetical protein